ncbi:MAG: DUF1634 domain-containing protein [Acidobacteriota bacterium]|nr:DUF1634 domain-containing protein [Acidobacteriota bacterium]MDE3170118.1 DUF1634 domain-containing protein [Acidobacteriota bacterium]
MIPDPESSAKKQIGSSAVELGETKQQFDMDALVGYILLIGVLISLALVIAALIWRWADTRTLAFDYRIAGMNLFQLLLNEIRLGMQGALRPRLLLSLGIAMLMLTPYIRVLASMVYFMVSLKNWKYSVFTAVVLLTLTYSLFLR